MGNSRPGGATAPVNEPAEIFRANIVRRSPMEIPQPRDLLDTMFLQRSA